MLVINNPSTFVTEFSSEACENGSTQWTKMLFHTVRPINAEEAQVVLEHMKAIKEGIDAEKAYYASREDAPALRAPGENDEDYQERQKLLGSLTAPVEKF